MYFPDDSTCVAYEALQRGDVEPLCAYIREQREYIFVRYALPLALTALLSPRLGISGRLKVLQSLQHLRFDVSLTLVTGVANLLFWERNARSWQHDRQLHIAALKLLASWRAQAATAIKSVEKYLKDELEDCLTARLLWLAADALQRNVESDALHWLTVRRYFERRHTAVAQAINQGGKTRDEVSAKFGSIIAAARTQMVSCHALAALQVLEQLWSQKRPLAKKLMPRFLDEDLICAVLDALAVMPAQQDCGDLDFLRALLELFDEFPLPVRRALLRVARGYAASSWFYPALEDLVAKRLGDDDLWAGAAEVLSDIRPELPETIEALVKRLSMPGEDQTTVDGRCFAAKAIGRAGANAEAAVPALAVKLRAKHPKEAAAAAIAIGRIGIQTSDVRLELSRLVRENQGAADAYTVRRAALFALGMCGADCPEAASAVAQALAQNPRDDVAYFAARHLVTSGQGMLEQLSIGESRGSAAEQAAYAIARLPGSFQTKTALLLQILATDDAAARRAAAEGLRSIEACRNAGVLKAMALRLAQQESGVHSRLRTPGLLITGDEHDEQASSCTAWVALFEAISCGGSSVRRQAVDFIVESHRRNALTGAALSACAWLDAAYTLEKISPSEVVAMPEFYAHSELAQLVRAGKPELEQELVCAALAALSDEGPKQFAPRLALRVISGFRPTSVAALDALRRTRGAQLRESLLDDHTSLPNMALRQLAELTRLRSAERPRCFDDPA